MDRRTNEWSMKHWWNDTDRGNCSTGRKTSHSATFPARNHTWTGLALNPGPLQWESPVTLFIFT